MTAPLTAGLYLHLPFCLSKCRYCDFNSYPLSDYTGSVEAYLDALLEEIRVRCEGYAIKTVFLGGGTPTVLTEKNIEKLIKGIFKNSGVTKGAEFSCEANPGTLTAAKIKVLLENGVNRLSLGLQSTKDTVLKTLGRAHSYSDFLTCYKAARKAGFNNINVDLIFGVPGQTLQGVKDDIYELTALKPEHISIYNLSLEENTPLFADVKRGIYSLPGEDMDADMYYSIKDILEKAGFIHYEISNYARAGKECKHNEIYWKNGDYIGAGAGAASKTQRSRSLNIEDIEEYIVLIKKNKNAIIQSQKLSQSEELSEAVFLGLRMLEGLCLSAFKKRFGKDFFVLFGEKFEKLSGLNLLEQKNGYIKLSRNGLFLSNEVFVEFV